VAEHFLRRFNSTWSIWVLVNSDVHNGKFQLASTKWEEIALGLHRTADLICRYRVLNET